MEEKISKIENCSNLLDASIHFFRYLFSSEFDRLDASFLDNFPREDFMKLFISHAALMMSIYKEKVMEKVGDSKNVKITDEYFSILVDRIKTKSFNTDCAYYKDRENVFDVIRNKLLHGSFDIVDDNNISFYINNDEKTTVSISDLTTMSSLMCPAIDSKKEGIRHRRLILFRHNELLGIQKITNKGDIKRALSSIYCLDITDIPQKGFERTEDFVRFFNGFVEDFRNNKDDLRVPIYELFRKHYIKYKKYFDYFHMNVNFSVSKVSKLPEYKEILDFLTHDINVMKEIDDKSVSELLGYIITTISTYFNVRDDGGLLLFTGFLNNLLFLKTYLDGNPVSEVDYNISMSNTFIDDMTVASLFNLFYFMYQYGLDDIFSDSYKTSLRDVLDGNVLRYDELILPNLGSNAFNNYMNIEFDFKTSFTNELLKMKNKLDELEKFYKRYQTSVEKFRASRGEDAKVPERLSKELNDAYYNYMSYLEYYNKAVDFVNNNCDKFEFNYNVIAHIRNAISHGGVELFKHTYGDTLNDRLISIKDHKDGKESFSLLIFFDEFIYLFCDENYALIKEFLEKQKKKYELDKEGVYS